MKFISVLAVVVAAYLDGSSASIYLYRNGEEAELPISWGSSFDPTEYSAFLKFLIQPGDLVFDVGAHIGKNTGLYLDCGNEVISIEPQPECVAILQAKFGSDPRVRIEPIGLGSSEGILEMHVSSFSPTISTFSHAYTVHSRFAERGCIWDKKIAVPISTLEAMIQKYGVPQYCKIDVENFELEVLKGLHQPISLLSFECNTDQIETSKNCLEYLKGLGYRDFNFAFGERGYFISPVWLSAEALLDKIEFLTQSSDFSPIWGLWGDIYARIQ